MDKVSAQIKTLTSLQPFTATRNLHRILESNHFEAFPVGNCMPHHHKPAECMH